MIKDVIKIEVDSINGEVTIQFKNNNILKADSGSLNFDITPKYDVGCDGIYNMDIKVSCYGKLYPPEKKYLTA